MSKPVQLTEGQWEEIRQHIADNYPPSVLLIRDCMRRNLGFTMRVHTKAYPWWGHGENLSPTIMLDFYDEPKRTMFLLKYGDYLHGD